MAVSVSHLVIVGEKAMTNGIAIQLLFRYHDPVSESESSRPRSCSARLRPDSKRP